MYAFDFRLAPLVFHIVKCGFLQWSRSHVCSNEEENTFDSLRTLFPFLRNGEKRDWMKNEKLKWNSVCNCIQDKAEKWGINLFRIRMCGSRNTVHKAFILRVWVQIPTLPCYTHIDHSQNWAWVKPKKISKLARQKAKIKCSIKKSSNNKCLVSVANEKNQREFFWLIFRRKGVICHHRSTLWFTRDFSDETTFGLHLEFGHLKSSRNVFLHAFERFYFELEPRVM